MRKVCAAILSAAICLSVEGLVSFRLFGKCYWQAGGVCGFDFLRVEHPLG